MTMREVNLPLVNNADCQNKLRTKLGENYNLDSSFICAGGEPGNGENSQTKTNILSSM